MIDTKILKKEEKTIFALRSLYKSYGYLPFKMSKFEEYDLYVGNKDFLVSDRVITFNDTDGKLLALKPDVTLSIIKNTLDKAGAKSKVYYNENVYRVSGSTGQFKEIMQAGLECIGDIDTSDVYEALLLADKSLRATGSEYALDISHMGLLSALLDEASDSVAFKKEITPLIAEKNLHETLALCDKYSVSPEGRKIAELLATLYGTLTDVIEKLTPVCVSEAAGRALSELSEISHLISAEDDFGKLRFDFSVVNNMNYYDGIVFKGFLSGICEGVLSGGEYGKLLANMGRKSRAVGFALYLDLLSELEDEREDYDVDVFILYSENTAICALSQKKKEIVNSGKTVTSGRALPEKLRYRELIKM